MSATDQDAGINGQLSYYIESSYQDSNLVSMDRDTGLVMAKAPLDYEKIKQLKFNVIAVDHGFKPRTGEGRICGGILGVVLGGGEPRGPKLLPVASIERLQKRVKYITNI